MQKINQLLASFVIAILVLQQSHVGAASGDDDSCYSYAGGSVYPEGEVKIDHKLQFTKAVSKYYIHIHFIYIINSFLVFKVSRQAPKFEGTAVVNGEFTQLKLTDYLGKYVVFFFYPLDL